MTRSRERSTTHKNQGGVEVFIVLLGVVGIVFSRLFLVHRVKVKTSVVVLDGLEKRSERILKAMVVQRCVREVT